MTMMRQQRDGGTLPYRYRSLCGYSAGGLASFSSRQWEGLELGEEIHYDLRKDFKAHSLFLLNVCFI